MTTETNSIIKQVGIGFVAVIGIGTIFISNYIVEKNLYEITTRIMIIFMLVIISAYVTPLILFDYDEVVKFKGKEIHKYVLRPLPGYIIVLIIVLIQFSDYYSNLISNLISILIVILMILFVLSIIYIYITEGVYSNENKDIQNNFKIWGGLLIYALHFLSILLYFMLSGYERGEGHTRLRGEYYEFRENLN
jgi:hypothetical protein